MGGFEILPLGAAGDRNGRPLPPVGLMSCLVEDKAKPLSEGMDDLPVTSSNEHGSAFDT